MSDFGSSYVRLDDRPVDRPVFDVQMRFILLT